MRHRWLIGGVLATFGSLLLSSGCGSEEDNAEPSCATRTCPFDYSTFDSSEPVSFQNDVFPLLRRSCGLSTSCHGAGFNAGAAFLYLGPKLSDKTTVIDSAFLGQIIDGLVGVTSKTVPGTSGGSAGAGGASGAGNGGGAKLVVAGDPSQSFLMLKLDNCQAAANLTCVKIASNKSGKLCGKGMPDGNLLCDDERDIFRRWIAQGAQNN